MGRGRVTGLPWRELENQQCGGALTPYTAPHIALHRDHHVCTLLIFLWKTAKWGGFALMLVWYGTMRALTEAETDPKATGMK